MWRSMGLSSQMFQLRGSSKAPTIVLHALGHAWIHDAWRLSDHIGGYAEQNLSLYFLVVQDILLSCPALLW